MRLPSADCEDKMICKECAKAAEINAGRVERDEPLVLHPDNCGCPCKHMRPGAWKGKK